MEKGILPCASIPFALASRNLACSQSYKHKRMSAKNAAFTRSEAMSQGRYFNHMRVAEHGILCNAQKLLLGSRKSEAPWGRDDFLLCQFPTSAMGDRKVQQTQGFVCFLEVAELRGPDRRRRNCELRRKGEQPRNRRRPCCSTPFKSEGTSWCGERPS